MALSINVRDLSFIIHYINANENTQSGARITAQYLKGFSTLDIEISVHSVSISLQYNRSVYYSFILTVPLAINRMVLDFIATVIFYHNSLM